MPDNSDAAASRFDEKALKAFLDGLLDELRYPQDPKLLEDVRKAFRKKIPLHLRSYAAALMILRAAGLSKAKPQQKMPPQKASAEKMSPPIKALPKKMAPQSQKTLPQEPPSNEIVSLFVSMGKRHHLKPQDLRNKIAERTGLSLDAIGRVHLLEKYSFVEVPVEEAQKVIAAMNGAELNGHALEIKPAKKRAKTSSKG